MAQSPEFNIDADKQWFRYYRLLPSSSVALQQLLQFATPITGILRLGSLGKACFFVADAAERE
jgi:hypothetical protein